MTEPADILTFWFGEHFEQGMPVRNRNELWFGFSPKIDEQIKKRFGADVIKAANGDYEHWKSDPEGRLALIILLDQFPRNIYRGRSEAFAFDKQALALCLEGLDLGHDTRLMPSYRSFFYLPLEHSESLDLQRHCVALFQALYTQVNPAVQPAIKSSLDYARLHCDIIERFGRFPHRNALLGRRSTAAEEAFLQTFRVNFGQGNDASSTDH